MTYAEVVEERGSRVELYIWIIDKCYIFYLSHDPPIPTIPIDGEIDRVLSSQGTWECATSFSILVLL